MTGKKRLTVFGATGSVGSSALSLVREHPDKFSLHALSANRDYHSLAQLALLNVKVKLIGEAKELSP